MNFTQYVYLTSQPGHPLKTLNLVNWLTALIVLIAIPLQYRVCYSIIIGHYYNWSNLVCTLNISITPNLVYCLNLYLQKSLLNILNVCPHQGTGRSCYHCHSANSVWLLTPLGVSLKIILSFALGQIQHDQWWHFVCYCYHNDFTSQNVITIHWSSDPDLNLNVNTHSTQLVVRGTTTSYLAPYTWYILNLSGYQIWYTLLKG